MNPLEKLKNWYESLDTEIQLEIAALAGHFHYDKTIENEFEPIKKISQFKNYMESTELSNVENVQRTLFTIKLISFSIDGRSTEADWSETIDRHLDIRNRIKEKEEESTAFVDDMLKKIPERKAIWIKVCSEWNNLIRTDLSDKNIADWYYFKQS